MKAQINWDWYWSVSHFDSSHWWQAEKHKKRVTQAAAWYELLRRNPKLEKPVIEITNQGATRFNAKNVATTWEVEQRLRVVYGPAPLPVTLLNILAVICKKNWLDLSEQDKRAFEEVLGKTSFQKGRTRTSDVQVIVDPTKWPFNGKSDLAKHVRNEARNFADDFLHRAFDQKLIQTFRPSFRTGSPSWFAFLYQAIINRKIVIAIDLETDAPEATAKAMSAEYLRIYKQLNSHQLRKRSRWESWLPVVAAFELSEAHRRSSGQPRKVNQAKRLLFQKLFSRLPLNL